MVLAYLCIPDRQRKRLSVDLIGPRYTETKSYYLNAEKCLEYWILSVSYQYFIQQLDSVRFGQSIFQFASQFMFPRQPLDLIKNSLKYTAESSLQD